MVLKRSAGSQDRRACREIGRRVDRRLRKLTVAMAPTPPTHLLIRSRGARAPQRPQTNAETRPGSKRHENCSPTVWSGRLDTLWQKGPRGYHPPARIRRSARRKLAKCFIRLGETWRATRASAPHTVARRSFAGLAASYGGRSSMGVRTCALGRAHITARLEARRPHLQYIDQRHWVGGLFGVISRTRRL